MQIAVQVDDLEPKHNTKLVSPDGDRKGWQKTLLCNVRTLAALES